MVTSISSGHGIFVNGIPSSGKTSVATEIKRRIPSFQIIAGDDLVRQALGGPENVLQVPREQLPAAVRRVFAVTLDMIEEATRSANVVLDGAWTEQQVTEAKSRLGASALFAILRIDETERQRREAARTDRRLTFPWDPAWRDMPGPDELYDLVLDAAASDVSACADAILAEYTKRWGDPSR